MIDKTATAARIAEIVAGAQTRAALGQAAQHAIRDDGGHEVRVYDRTTGRLLVGIGATVAEAVANIAPEEGGPTDA